MDKSDWACSDFEPQQWRKRKCKHCFQDIELHLEISRDVSNCYSKPDNYENNCEAAVAESHHSNEQQNADLEDALDREVSEITRTIDNDKTQRDKEVKTCIEKTLLASKTNAFGDSQGVKANNATTERESFAIALKSYDEDSPLIPRKYSLDAGGLLTRSVEFSSTSSLASFDALEDNTLSSYSYSGSRENLDGFISGDELSFQEATDAKQQVTPSEKDTLVSAYKEEIENLQDNIKCLEWEKDRAIQSLERELQGMKLELTKYSARENITILKNRLEIEGKNQVIQELQDEVDHLHRAVEDLNSNRDSDETKHDWLQREVNRRSRRVQCLEEEKRTLEERLSLAEDLQKNDRDLLDVLRNQLTSLESDLLSSEGKSKQLEREVKSLKAVEIELTEQKEISHGLRKHVDFLNGKLKLREQHVSYLEEDNVKMQQEKTDLEMKIEKDREKIDRLNSVVKQLKKDIQASSKEVDRLYEENSGLEQAHWQAVINQTDASGELETYIKDLENRVNQSENKVRELEAENESLIDQSREMLENLVVFESEMEESKRQLDLMTESYNRLQSMKTDQDKRVMTMQRKLKKLQKEKKRFQIEKQEAEEKISMLRVNDDKVSSKCDDIEKGYKMLQLKLQSTEAKLTMVERNKIYMESKIKEYENRLKSNSDKISELCHIVNEYLDITGVETDRGDRMESFEVNLKKLLHLNDRTISELKSYQEINNDLLRVIDFGEKRIKKFSEYLELAEGEKKALKHQLDEKSNDCQRLHDSFLTSVTFLTQQNDFLEGKLIEMKELEKALKYYENALYGNVGDGGEPNGIEIGSSPLSFKDDSGIESMSCQNEKISEKGIQKHFDLENLGEVISKLNDNDTVALSANFLPANSTQPENTYVQDLINNDPSYISVPETSLANNDSSTDEQPMNLFFKREGTDEDCYRCLEFQNTGHGNLSVIADSDKGDRMTLETDKSIEDQNSSLQGSQSFLAAELNQDLETFSLESQVIMETSGIYTQMETIMEKAACDVTEISENEACCPVSPEYPTINSPDAPGSIEEVQMSMENSRPFTSIKCIFQVEDDQPSKLDYSQLQANNIFCEGAYGSQQNDLITNERLSYRDSCDADNESQRCRNEKNETLNKNSSGSFYSFAASDIEFCQPPNEISRDDGSVTRKDSGLKTNGHKLSFGKLFQISKEDSGAITLTIPSSSLENDDGEEVIEEVKTDIKEEIGEQENDVNVPFQSRTSEDS